MELIGTHCHTLELIKKSHEWNTQNHDAGPFFWHCLPANLFFIRRCNFRASVVQCGFAFLGRLIYLYENKKKMCDFLIYGMYHNRCFCSVASGVCFLCKS